jgi:hypothetical protein
VAPAKFACDSKNSLGVISSTLTGPSLLFGNCSNDGMRDSGSFRGVCENKFQVVLRDICVPRNCAPASLGVVYNVSGPRRLGAE